MDAFHNDSRFMDHVIYSLKWAEFLRHNITDQLIPFMFMWDGDKRYTNMLHPGGDPEEFAYKVAGKSENPFDHFVIGYEGKVGTSEDKKEDVLIVKGFKKDKKTGVFLAQPFIGLEHGVFEVKGDPIMVGTPENPLPLESTPNNQNPYQEIVFNGMVFSKDDMNTYMGFFMHENPATIYTNIKHFIRDRISGADHMKASGVFNIQINPMEVSNGALLKYCALAAVREERKRTSSIEWENKTNRKLKFNINFDNEKWLEEEKNGSNKNDPIEHVEDNEIGTDNLDSHKKESSKTITKKDQYKDAYEGLSAMQLKREVTRIRSIPNARTNVDCLERMVALMDIMEKRDIDLPGSRPPSASGYKEELNENDSGSISPGRAIWIVVIVILVLFKLARLLS